MIRRFAEHPISKGGRAAPKRDESSQAEGQESHEREEEKGEEWGEKAGLFRRNLTGEG